MTERERFEAWIENETSGFTEDDEGIAWAAWQASLAQPVTISDQLARHAIDGALAKGRANSDPPPSGHWLTEYWDIGRSLAIAGVGVLPR